MTHNPSELLLRIAPVDLLHNSHNWWQCVVRLQVCVMLCVGCMKAFVAMYLQVVVLGETASFSALRALFA